MADFLFRKQQIYSIFRYFYLVKRNKHSAIQALLQTIATCTTYWKWMKYEIWLEFVNIAKIWIGIVLTYCNAVLFTKHCEAKVGNIVFPSSKKLFVDFYTVYIFKSIQFWSYFQSKHFYNTSINCDKKISDRKNSSFIDQKMRSFSAYYKITKILIVDQFLYT